ncbi:phosphate acetyltransferase [Candidatus Pantoea edessiphila]|uniref:Phosphate acetyltransferase n=1 Tax=Candidatus Pantoea edessiphila TaxID=2044610 RepID=A0A2P5SYL2_9GAMM|nr:phosphate acetyltransferase [Candidatus Pantoea edessiphila]MBK4775479.1 phosphate acetyltransferase [Pantoea sp. Edef]PPI87392.1 phosphate acetyltransferase [Candidatus Pantoea edessiphila]
MPRAIILVPIYENVGFQSVILGLIHAIERKDISVKIFRPIIQNDKYDQFNDIFSKHNLIAANKSLKMKVVKSILSVNRQDILIEEIISKYYFCSKNIEVVLIEGLPIKYQFSNSLNYEIAKALNAEIIFILSIDSGDLLHIKEHIKLTSNSFGGIKNKNIVGVIINKLNAPMNQHNHIYHDISEITNDSDIDINFHRNEYINKISENIPVPILGCIPWNHDLMSIRAIDIYNHLKAHIINRGDIITRRIKSITFCNYSLSNIVKYLKPGSMLITSADRPEVIIAICLAIMNGVKIAAILLTGNYKINNCITKLCECSFQTGVPVFMVSSNTWQTSINLQNLNINIPADDIYRIEKTQKYIAGFISTNWINSLKFSSNSIYRLFSPPAFRYHLTELARKSNKCIILPEGNEPRTIKAATICTERKIASCILLGCADEIRDIALSEHIDLKSDIIIINPNKIKHNYIPRLVELRKNKGMTESIAQEQLEDNVVLATMMLENNEVDGLVSGAVHTTAHTIKPSLQIIKTAPNNSLISSIFFMLLPEKVLVYGDCAINPDPNPMQLAEIAIQSADSAKFFGIQPIVAMISYSTGNSGFGNHVEKVRQATIIAQRKRPDLIIDGPLQYDAAIVEDVAKFKAPNSKVAGKATVFIFPDLNTGNTTYKAVQRSANLISIGPMLQGIRKPVNDLSRGASVDDIVYTIALTAIQSLQQIK